MSTIMPALTEAVKAGLYNTKEKLQELRKFIEERGLDNPDRADSCYLLAYSIDRVIAPEKTYRLHPMEVDIIDDVEAVIRKHLGQNL